jgi:dipeptidyl aminopeptidase/acylaminoacyl peptidase
MSEKPTPPIRARPVIPADRLQRAVALLRPAVAAKIRNGRVIPQWLPGQDRFWYRREVAGGTEFTLVNACTGARQPAFDHAAVAAALAAAAGAPVDALQLPVQDIAADGEALIPTLALAGVRYVCALGTPWRCKRIEQARPDPAWLVSPDGRNALLVRDHRLWLRDTATGAEQALVEQGEPDFGFGITPDAWMMNHIPRSRARQAMPPFQASWSPDSRRVLVPLVDQRHVAPYPFVENVPLDGSFRPRAHAVRVALTGEPSARLSWHVIDVQTRQCRPIAIAPEWDLATERSVVRSWWRADSLGLFIMAQTPERDVACLLAVDAQDGAARICIADRSMPGRVFDGGGAGAPAVRLLGGGREIIWLSMQDGWAHLYRHDGSTGALMNRITAGPWLVRDIIAVDEARGILYFTACGREPGNPYHRRFYRVGLDGSALQLIGPEPGAHQLVDPSNRGMGMDGVVPHEALSPSGDFVVLSVSSVASPAACTVRRTTDGSLVATVETADASALLAAGYRPPQELVAKAADGMTDLHGLVYRPSDHDPSRRYAVIDVQYASPLVAATPRDFNQAACAMIDFFTCAATAELGFIVVVVDARGTPNRSQAFSAPAPGYLDTMGLDDHVAFIRTLAQQDASVDLDRIGISGISFGGWASLRGLLRHPDFFKVGVAGAPPGRFQAMYGMPRLTTAQAPIRYQGGAQTTRPGPTDVPDGFDAIDCAAQVGQLAGKLLLIMGEQDENVLPGSTLQFFDAAMQADKDVELVYLPNATHFGLYTGYVLRRVWSFLLAHLNGSALPPGTALPSPLAKPR